MSIPKSFGFWCLEYDCCSETNFKGYDYKTFKTKIELYYDPNKKKWVKRDEFTGCWYPASYSCHSLKAAKRHLKKHDEIPKGTKFRLVSRYIGCDIWLVKK